MFSIKGIYTNGAVKCLEPVPVEGDSEVIITFIENEAKDGFSLVNKYSADNMEIQSQSDQIDEDRRRHKRYKANGVIELLDEDIEKSYHLHDYSAGGLSFIVDHPFEPNKIITASLKYKTSGAVLEMKFKIEIKRVINVNDEDKLQVGCQFLDAIDEKLWHTILN
jgi:hypothetical protein